MEIDNKMNKSGILSMSVVVSLRICLMDITDLKAIVTSF